MSNFDRKIAEAIVYAQMASDAGKHKYDLHTEKGNKARHTKYAGYSFKDGYIFSAIQMINGTKNCGFRYYITAQPDQNGYNSFVIYFTFKVDGKRKQVSFHSFNKKLWKDKVGDGMITHWDRQIGGSVKSCQSLINFYKI